VPGLMEFVGKRWSVIDATDALNGISGPALPVVSPMKHESMVYPGSKNE